jgi:hypothetical protein
MTIYVVATCAEPFLAAVRAQAARSPDAQYTIVHVPHTWTELNALALRIGDAKGQWRARGVRLSVHPDAAASKVIVTVLPYRRAVAEALTAAYGHDWISVVPSSARYIPLTSGATRLVTPDGREPCFLRGHRLTGQDGAQLVRDAVRVPVKGRFQIAPVGEAGVSSEFALQCGAPLAGRLPAGGLSPGDG